MSLNIWTHEEKLILKKLGYSTSLFDSLTMSYPVTIRLRACLKHLKRKVGFIRHSSLVTKQIRKYHTQTFVESRSRMMETSFVLVFTTKKMTFLLKFVVTRILIAIYQNLLLTLLLWVNSIDSIAFVTPIYHSLDP